jgi:hypothetical protein
MKDRVDNLTAFNIRDFLPGESTIYISKMKQGYQITYLCKFIEFKRGIVTGEIINADPGWAMSNIMIGNTITARLTKCYLWGLGRDSRTGRTSSYCHWFDKTGVVK